MAEVTIAQAAQRLGVSYDTIRRRIRKGELAGRRVRMRQGMVWLVEIPEDLENAPEDAPASDSNAPTTPETTPAVEIELRARIVALEGNLGDVRGQLDARTREVRELHVLLQGLQRALPQPRQEPEQAPADAGAAPRRAPWWRRLVGRG